MGPPLEIFKLESHRLWGTIVSPRLLFPDPNHTRLSRYTKLLPHQLPWTVLRALALLPPCFLHCFHKPPNSNHLLNPNHGTPPPLLPNPKISTSPSPWPISSRLPAIVNQIKSYDTKASQLLLLAPSKAAASWRKLAQKE